MSRKEMFRWEAAGAAFIIVAGSALHFVFEWSGGFRPVAWLAAVNESTWEHFKLGFWPAVLFALFELRVWKGKKPANFWVGKAACLWTMPFLIGMIFYGYKAVLGRHFLWADISLFVLAAVVGQYLSYRILAARPLGSGWKPIALAGIVILLAAFALLTYFPPRIFLFMDPRSGGYGIY
jgi:hypothetical protein